MNLQTTINTKINYIYQILIKIGYPNLEISSHDVQSAMDLYFQPTTARLSLLEWLIAIINPEYNLQPEYLLLKHE